MFFEALALPADQRASFLEAACAGDPGLRREVEALLRADAGTGGALDDPSGAAGLFAALEPTGHGDEAAAAPDRLIGREAGGWRLVRRVGRGGMASVYLAERADGAFEGRAAVKVVRAGFDSEDVVRRFHAERSVLARLEHPHIARLLDGGAFDDGRPYLVMEFVDGEPIDGYCEARRLTIEQRLRLFLVVCDAVQFAHQNLVVHRDLKPGNILVTDAGQVKLLDFGIASVIAGDADDGTLTAAHQRPYTPRYASPEQVAGQRVTTSSDVYSLAVLLYELLTGTAPDRSAVAAAPSVAAARGRSIPAEIEGGPQRLARRLRGDLDAIVLRALRPEPARRYATALELGDDVRRHLERLPVRARRGSAAYRTGRYVRRHAAALGTAAVIAVVLVGATAVSLRRAAEAREARAVAERERAVALDVSAFLRSVFSAANPQVAQGRDVTVLRELLEAAAQRSESGLAGRSDVAAEIHLTLAETYRQLADFASAERHVERALEVMTDLPRADPALHARILHERAGLRLDTSRYDDALGDLDQATRLAGHAVWKEDDPRVAMFTTRGRIEEARGAYAAAESSYRAGIAATIEARGPRHPDVASRRSDLAVLLMNRSPDRREAESLLRDAVRIWRESDTPYDSLQLATGLHNTGGLLRRERRLEEAEPFYREALGIQRRILGDRHPSVAVTLNGLGSLLEQAGRLSEAEAHYRETLALQQASLGDAHRDVGTTFNNLGGVLRRQGRLDEADAMFVRAIGVYRRTLGADHAWVAIAFTNRLHLLEQRGDWRGVRHGLDEALPIARLRFSGGSEWRVAVLESLNGACMVREGRVADGRARLETSRRDLVAALGDADPHVRDAERRLQLGGGP